MTTFIQNDATGAGSGNLDPNVAFANLAVIANGDTGLGLAPQVGNRQQVTYGRTLNGVPPMRLDNLVNTVFNPDYGGGPQTVNIIVISVLANFTLNNGAMITTIGGTALPPNNSGLPGAGLNTTNDCLVIYDTSQSGGVGYCAARAGTGGTLDLPIPNAVILYHELSHAFRTVNNTALALSTTCNPSSPEENAAITDENDLRAQLATAQGVPVVLRDPGIHCGTTCGSPPPNCCIVASVASGSPLSDEVAALRSLRDGLLRRSEVGFAFFESLHHDYYAFSPQVCTLLARHPDLRLLVRDGLVRPLVSVLQLLKLYACGENAATLGQHFLAQHVDRAASAARLEILDTAQRVLEASDAELTAVQRQLAGLLAPALDSEHVAWAMIDPLRIYQRILRSFLDEPTDVDLGKQLYDGMSNWAARMPLDDVWPALTAAEVRRELAMLDNLILRTATARTDVRRRLNEEVGVTLAADSLRDAAEWE